MTTKGCATAGSESEFQPGSRGRVLRNLLGITRAGAMEEAESRALAAVQTRAQAMFGRNHRFTPADIRRLHRMWLGSIYPWAGTYRTVNLEKTGLRFAHAGLIPRLMANFGKEVLRSHTPCREGGDAPVARSLAEVHARLILIHPFRDGNARLARLVAVLMASQAGLNPLRLSALAGRGRRTYVQAIHAAKNGEYAPLEMLFSCALEERPWRTQPGCPKWSI